MTSHGTNWIDGAEVPALRGAWFEFLAADGRTGLGRRPRSTDEDLVSALGAARRAEQGWRALGGAARRDILARAAARLVAAPDPGGLARAALGFEAAEITLHLAGLGAWIDDGLQGSPLLARGPLGARDGPCFLAPSWSATWHAPARAVFFALAVGRAVILAPDGRLPSIGDALSDALAELPRGVFAVLHDDGRTLARAALAATDPPTSVVGEDRIDPGATLGQHVVVARARRSTAVIDPGADVDAQVERAVDGAIGRARALSGSRSGQIGRLVVPERAFSRVTDRVLARTERSPDAGRPLPPARVAQDARLVSALALGIDEGATAVLAGVTEAEAPFPIVFTNVEPTMRIARLEAPLGLLALLRARDLRSAHALAARLDQEVRS